MGENLLDKSEFAEWKVPSETGNKTLPIIELDKIEQGEKEEDQEIEHLVQEYLKDWFPPKQFIKYDSLGTPVIDWNKSISPEWRESFQQYRDRKTAIENLPQDKLGKIYANIENIGRQNLRKIEQLDQDEQQFIEQMMKKVDSINTPEELQNLLVELNNVCRKYALEARELRDGKIDELGVGQTLIELAHNFKDSKFRRVAAFGFSKQINSVVSVIFNRRLETLKSAISKFNIRNPKIPSKITDKMLDEVYWGDYRKAIAVLYGTSKIKQLADMFGITTFLGRLFGLRKSRYQSSQK